MPYDDDGSSIMRFRDFEDLAILLERYLGVPENITASRLIALTRAVHTIAGERKADEVSLDELAHGLRQRGLGTVPFETVVRVLEATDPIGAQEDPLEQITLRQVHGIITH